MKASRRISLSTFLSKTARSAAIILAATCLFFAPFALRAANFYASTPTNLPWPGGIVPYQFTNLTTAQQTTFLDGLREWELAGGVHFVPYTNQARWILFSYNTNFLDFVSGGGYSPQMVTVSSLSRAQVCHEMGHSFGFTHENIRTDKTNYIIVLTNNIYNESSNIYWFTIDPTSVAYSNYDYESVMHLGWDFVSINTNSATQQPTAPYFPKYQYRMGNFCLSPGDRAALKYLYGPPLVPLTNVVTTTADVGPGSLRAAMYYVTDNPGTTVRFNIPTNDPGYSNGVYNIHLTGMLPPLASNGMVIDGSTQPGFTGNPLIVVDGSQIIPETATSNSGLLIYSASNQVKNIIFQGFNWNGLTLEYSGATNNTIAGCWIGLAANGSNSAANALQGIFFNQGAGHNTIGGTNALARNVISGNGQYGMWMSDTNTTGNVILGNYIGTDSTGSFAVSNSLGGIGIFTNGAGHVIGGTNTNARNVISGNGGPGVFLSGPNVSNNVVEGNFLGLNAAGTGGVPNFSAGIYVNAGATSNAVLNNVISSNNNIGLYISDPGTSGNVFQGNFIGTDSTGEIAVGNPYEGVALQGGATSNLIGGTAPGAANVISGNYYGLTINGTGTSGNIIEGNLIGVDITGKTELANAYEGLAMGSGAASNTIGGTAAGAGNVISGNYYNVVVQDAGTTGNVFEGNYIGVDITGKTALTNQYEGFGVGNGAASNIIGGTVASAANVISGHDIGMIISDAGTSGNLIEGNLIGTDFTGTNAIANAFNNIQVQNNAANNFIGGIGAGQGNVIAFSPGDGVALYGSTSTNISIRGNSIFANGYLGIDLTGTGNNLQAAPVITNAHGYSTSTIVMGTLSSAANSSFYIDVYRNLPATPSQGQYYLGTVSVTTGGTGNASFALTNSTANYSGDYFTATATSASGNTSQFSGDVLATNVPAPSAQFNDSLSAWHTNGFVFTLTLATNFGYHVQTTTNLSGNPIVWSNLTNFTANNPSLTLTDRTATNFHLRFYRVTSP